LRLFLYKFFTQLIVILGVLRQRVGCREVFRGDRTFFNGMDDIRLPAWGSLMNAVIVVSHIGFGLGEACFSVLCAPKNTIMVGDGLRGLQRGFLRVRRFDACFLLVFRFLAFYGFSCPNTFYIDVRSVS